jgi:uncharacterized SAM-binding protein YcdF (DUF218 family)
LRGATLFWFLFSTGGVLTTLVVATAWLLIRPRSRRARASLVLLVGGFTLVSMPPVPLTVEHWISAPYRPLAVADVPPGRTIVVLLGSGGYRRADWDGSTMAVLDPIGTERTLEAARVYRLIQPAYVVSSGGLIDPDRPEAPAGDTMKDALVRLGVPPDRIIVENKSTNTRDEATIVAGMLPSLGADRVVIVTSAIHMRRAVGMFRAVGIEGIPAIARGPESVGGAGSVLPSDGGLRLTALVVHELAGLTYYRLKGWYR